MAGWRGGGAGAGAGRIDATIGGGTVCATYRDQVSVVRPRLPMPVMPVLPAAVPEGVPIVPIVSMMTSLVLMPTK